MKTKTMIIFLLIVLLLFSLGCTNKKTNDMNDINAGNYVPTDGETDDMGVVTSGELSEFFCENTSPLNVYARFKGGDTIEVDYGEVWVKTTNEKIMLKSMTHSFTGYISTTFFVQDKITGKVEAYHFDEDSGKDNLLDQCTNKKNNPNQKCIFMSASSECEQIVAEDAGLAVYRNIKAIEITNSKSKFVGGKFISDFKEVEKKEYNGIECYPSLRGCISREYCITIRNDLFGGKYEVVEVSNATLSEDIFEVPYCGPIGCVDSYGNEKYHGNEDDGGCQLSKSSKSWGLDSEGFMQRRANALK